ncbi:MAG: Uma2 family endonuclease [Gemmataceae bacterium]
MTVAEAPALMTTEQLLALPDEGVERWLIRGQLREKPMTYRNRWHSRAMVRIGYFLEAWREQQPAPRGSVLGGEAGVRLTRNPDTTVGIDVVYISAEVANRNPDDTTIIDGVPVLAVEILSPNNTVEEIDEKIDQYLEAGVLLVWIADTRDRTVTIYRPGQEPEFVNARQELSGEPHLPGFRVRVADLFA